MNVRSLLQQATARLSVAEVESPALDARLLLQHALGMSTQDLVAHGDAPLAAHTLAEYEAMISRRAGREPMSHLLGEREFWGRRFAVNRHVLTPRPDTETLIEAVLADPRSRIPHLRILDLGTGSGCLLVTLLAELPHATGTAVDASEKALAVARANAHSNQVSERAEFILSNWCANITQKNYQIVVANPPYIASNGLCMLMPEVVEYEPHLALDGGTDGLESYRRIASELPPYLAPNALMVMEVGAGQHEAVLSIFESKGFHLDAFRHDLAGIARCVIMTHP